MIVSCLLCGNDGTQQFEQGSSLRDHLIEYHSKLIARAFLCPDIGDPNHVWLLGCVEYNNKEFDSGTVSPNTDCSSPSDTPSTQLVEVLTALLANAGSNVHSGDVQEDITSRKRCSNSAQPEEQPKRAHIELNDDFTGPFTFDPTLLFENGEEIASGSGLNEDGEKGWCKSCKTSIPHSSRHIHILEVHVSKPDMFSCSLCDFTHKSSILETRKHCSTVHPGEGGIVQSNEMKYKTLIQQWMRRCFDEKRFDMRTIGEDGESMNGRETQMGDSQLDQQPIPDGITVDDRTCHLCWEESRYPGRHIAQKHLRKPLYECPICEGFGSYESCTVTKHIHKVHPEADEQPISNLDKYAEEIREYQTRCFPNRPMKLVRPVQSGKPRERHLCNLCNTQVAQSDRQRHVYHRHLEANGMFECPLCSFSSNYDVHRVKWHIKWIHKEECEGIEPVSHENEFRDEINRLNEECFPGWMHRRRPFWWLDTQEAEKRIEMVKSKNSEDVHQLITTKDVIVNIKKESTPDVHEECSSSTDGQENKNNEFSCRLCKKEFKPSSNFLRHVAKEHLSIPLYQCPICEGVGAHDAYEIRTHIQKVHGKNKGCVQPISNLEMHYEEIEKVYAECFPGRKLKCLVDKLKPKSSSSSLPNSTSPVIGGNKVGGVKETKYEDVKVQCVICLMEMNTEDRQIHVYRHHLKEPRLYECPLCEFSHHACSSDVRAHIKFVHRDQPDTIQPRANLLEFSDKISEWNDKCFPGWINRRLPTNVLEDFNKCRLCDEEVRQTSRHIAEVHLHIPLHQCPLCEYGGAESRLVMRHLKNNHTKKEAKGLQPIANVIAHRSEFSSLHDKCFPGRPKRLSNITISDEGRRAKCKCCGATVSRKRRLQHILGKHLCREIFKCNQCDFFHIDDESIVVEHQKEKHGKEVDKVVNGITEYFSDILSIGQSCFPEWNISMNDLKNYKKEQ